MTKEKLNIIKMIDDEIFNEDTKNVNEYDSNNFNYEDIINEVVDDNISEQLDKPKTNIFVDTFDKKVLNNAFPDTKDKKSTLQDYLTVLKELNNLDDEDNNYNAFQWLVNYLYSSYNYSTNGFSELIRSEQDLYRGLKEEEQEKLKEDKGQGSIAKQAKYNIDQYTRNIKDLTNIWKLFSMEFVPKVNNLKKALMLHGGEKAVKKNIFYVLIAVFFKKNEWIDSGNDSNDLYKLLDSTDEVQTLRNNLIDLALSIILAFSKEDELYSNLYRQNITTTIIKKIKNSNEYETYRQSFHLAINPNLNLILKDRVGIEDKDERNEVNTLLSFIYLENKNESLSNTDLANLLSKLGEDLPFYSLYGGKIYSKDKWLSIFNNVRLSNYYNRHNEDTQMIIDNLNDLINHYRITNSGGKLKGTTEKILKSIDEKLLTLNELMSNQYSQNSFMVYNDDSFNNIDLKEIIPIKKDKNTYDTIGFKIRENMFYEDLLRKNSVLKFILLNEKDNKVFFNTDTIYPYDTIVHKTKDIKNILSSYNGYMKTNLLIFEVVPKRENIYNQNQYKSIKTKIIESYEIEQRLKTDGEFSYILLNPINGHVIQFMNDQINEINLQAILIENYELPERLEAFKKICSSNSHINIFEVHY